MGACKHRGFGYSGEKGVSAKPPGEVHLVQAMRIHPRGGNEMRPEDACSLGGGGWLM